MERILVTKTPLKLLVLNTVFGVLLYIASSFVFLFYLIKNPSYAEIFKSIPFIFWTAFVLIPISFFYWGICLMKIADLFEQEKERKI